MTWQNDCIGHDLWIKIDALPVWPNVIQWKIKISRDVGSLCALKAVIKRSCKAGQWGKLRFYAIFGVTFRRETQNENGK